LDVCNNLEAEFSAEVEPMHATPSAASTRRQSSSTTPKIEIRSLHPGDDTTAFRTLNEEWITSYFVLEEKDKETLGDPENTILRKGGHILIGYAGPEPVGCVALVPMGGSVFEISKMAVSRHLRGRGIGRQLVERAIGLARTIGATSLFLGTSTKLPSAIHLYESVGFEHVPPESLPPNPYARADVFMRLRLRSDQDEPE
jgi:GNAT superfamily N-acetyltransferase